MKKIVLLLSILLLFGCSKNIEYIDEIKINIGDNLPNSTDYINNYKNIDNITWDNYIEDMNYHANEYTGKISVDKKTINVKLSVVDKENPNIENVKDITIIEGNNIDLLKDVKVTDNSKDELKIEILGDYNINKAGTYNLKIRAVDVSNNESVKEFNLIVKEKPVKKEENIIVERDLSGLTTKGYEIKKINGAYYSLGIMVVNKTYDLSSNYNPKGLTSEFNNAFSKMKSAAKEDGVDIRVISGFRSYSYQKALYDGYVKSYGKASTDTFSARPGNSEHQTGLAADINTIDDNFGNTKAGKWLSENASKYGFILRYPKGKQNITGYKYEPWHFRYIGERAQELYKDGVWITLEEYLGIDSKYPN